MSFYVYIIANQTDSDLYKGYTENPLKRLEQHNGGEAQFTATKKNWHFVALFQFETKKDALIFEKKIKKWNKPSLLNLIADDKNILQQFLGSE